MLETFRLYAGDGTNVSQRGLHLPLFERTAALHDPSGYVAEPGLRDAVNVALVLGWPLLVTGEPGTGKTDLGASVAYELGLNPPLIFHTKTTSTARELFYRYDALRHFHDAQFTRDSFNAERYISYDALGKAILLAIQPEQANPFLLPREHGIGPARSVVLVDEVDKAPRDFPNDLLNEVEQMEFTVAETGRTFSAEKQYRPILILTSNYEKNMPDAFMRRCVFYHITFPDRERLIEIVNRRVNPSSAFGPEMLAHAVDRFNEIRELSLKKRPGTAECLGWIRILERMEMDVANLKPGQAETLAFSYSVLAKDKDDLERLREATGTTA